MLRKGDLLLIHSRFDPIGWVISWVTKSRWTHTAWILDSKWLLECRSSGVIKTPIKKYLGLRKRWIYDCRAFRIKGNPKKEIKEAMAYGFSLRTKHNYFKFIFSLILIGFKKRFKRTKMSCSGFVAICLATVKIKFNNKNSFFVTPGDIAKSKITEDVSAKELRYF